MNIQVLRAIERVRWELFRERKEEFIESAADVLAAMVRDMLRNNGGGVR